MKTAQAVPYGSAYGLDNPVAQNALRDAAAGAVDEALVAFGDFFHDDRIKLQASEGKGPVQTPAAPIVVSERLPAMYQEHYSSYGFLKRWVITLSIVGWKLAQPEPSALTNVAEELAMHVLIEDALTLLEIRSTETPEAIAQLNHLYKAAFEDNAFLDLYAINDPSELDDLDLVGDLGMADLRFDSLV